MGLQDVVRWFLPKEDHFYDFLEGQAGHARAAAKAMCGLRNGESLDEVRGKISQIEHDADKQFHSLEDALAQTFVTPIDREDLQQMGSELDDVVDFTNAAIRAAVLVGIKELTPPMHKLVDVLVEATTELEKGVLLLRRHQYESIREPVAKVRQLEKDGDQIYREAIRALFDDASADAKQILREKEILEDLENAIDRCDLVGGTLANLAVKHG
jgi:uncharacterized protein Yka (UPF0111/DUF47 family)